MILMDGRICVLVKAGYYVRTIGERIKRMRVEDIVLSVGENLIQSMYNEQSRAHTTRDSGATSRKFMYILVLSRPI